MSTALALGAVSAVLRNVLDNGLIDAVSSVGGPIKVTAKSPDLIKLDDPQQPPQLNLFLYRVSPNPGWRNAGLPSRDSDGRRITNPPLALDLHYLLTAYGREDLHAEILLGYGMHLLHERPFLDRAAIRKALELDPLDPTILPDAFQEPPAAGLADQFETLKVTLEPLDLENLSKLWSATQSHYRLSAGYQVSVVLIEATRPAGDPLPVLKRTVGVEPSLTVPLPTLERADRPVELGETVLLHGHHLAGTGITVRLSHPLLPAPHTIAIASNVDDNALGFALPATETLGQAWPAGVWSVDATYASSGRTTNTAALMLLPVPGATTLTRDPLTERVKVVVDVTPKVRPEQTVTIALNSAQATVGPRTAPAGQVEAEFGAIPTGPAYLRIRVGLAESRLVDESGPEPVFRGDRQVTVP